MRPKRKTAALAVTIAVGLGIAALLSQSSLALSPATAELLKAGDHDMAKGQLEEAAQSYREAIKLEPDSSECHNQLGLCYMRSNMLEEAASEFNKALEHNAKFFPSLNNLGTVYYRQGNYDQAIDFYSKALALRNGSDAELNTNLASAYRDRATFVGGSKRDRDYELAIEHYEKSIQDQENFPQAHNNLGLCLFRLKRFDEAASKIQHAISLKSDYAAAHYNLGLVEQARNRLPEALKAFQTSLQYETNPDYAESTRTRIKELGMPIAAGDHFSRGFDLLSQRRWKESEAEFRQAVVSPGENNVKNAIAWNNLGYVLAKQTRYRDAIVAYKKASQLLPGKFPAALYNMGQVLRSTGDIDGAEQCFRKALTEAKGTHALAHNALGIVLKQKGDLKGAQAQYRLALLQSGDTLPVVHYNLAILFEKQKDMKKQALEEFQSYLGHAPNGYNSPVARAKMAQLGQ